MSHDGIEAVTYFVFQEEDDLNQLFAEVLEYLEDGEGRPPAPLATVAFAFGHGETHEVGPLLDELVALPWQESDEVEGLQVLPAEDVPAALRKLAALVTNRGRFARAIGEATGEDLEVSDLPAVGADPRDLDTTSLRLAYLALQLLRMLRRAHQTEGALGAVWQEG